MTKPKEAKRPFDWRSDVPAYSQGVSAMLAHLLSTAADADRTHAPAVPTPTPLALDAVTMPRTLACYAWLSKNLPEPRVLRNASGGGAGWFVSADTLHGARRFKPGLASLDVGSSIELALGEDADAAADAPTPRRRLCIGLTYLKSYVHMGRAAVTCAGGCECAPLELDALDRSRHDSLFAAIELPALARRGAGCVLRLRNRGSSVGDSGGGESKFRLAGIYLAEPWQSANHSGAAPLRSSHCLLASDANASGEPLRGTALRLYGAQDVRFYGDR